MYSSVFGLYTAIPSRLGRVSTAYHYAELIVMEGCIGSGTALLTRIL